MSAQQAWRSGASSRHRRFNSFTLSRVWFPLPTDHCGRLRRHHEAEQRAPLDQAVRSAVTRRVLCNPLRKTTGQAQLSSSYSQSKTGLETGHRVIKTRGAGIRTQGCLTREAPLLIQLLSACGICPTPVDLGEGAWVWAGLGWHLLMSLSSLPQSLQPGEGPGPGVGHSKSG